MKTPAKRETRTRALRICRERALARFSEAFGLDGPPEKALRAYSGCQNLVYPCSRAGARCFLRVSVRADRGIEMLESELEYVEFLKSGGARVAAPARSTNGRLLETVSARGMELRAALFAKSEGEFFYERGWSLPEGAKASEFFENQGALLGRIRALASSWKPPRPLVRFDWLARHRSRLDGPEAMPELVAALPKETRRAALRVLDEIAALPRDGTYGPCHNDYNEGNFTVDYDHPPSCDVMLFDFDDCGWNYWMYDLACLWEANVGFAAYLADAADRRDRMDFVLERALRGYRREYPLAEAEAARLPLFLKACHVENLLEILCERLLEGRAAELDAETRYHADCLARNADWMGLYDDAYDPERPFESS